MATNILPTLQHLSCVKVALTIYTNPEVTAFERKYTCHSCKCIQDKDWDSYVRGKVSQCALPTVFQDKVVELITTLSSELNTWRRDHDDIFGYGVYRINNLWNSVGIIDRYEIAKRLVDCPDFPLKIRFKLACYYSMTSRVMQLWLQMSVEEKKDLENEDIVGQCYELPGYESEILGFNYVRDWIDWIQTGVSEGRRDPSIFYSRLRKKKNGICCYDLEKIS
ncbi:hypothetical protein NPIL_579701 [Nephila pilipes]|uniref:Uncharacterized protein n=1 Tax=Nephila pilipes TaxID=299642 RepID=A0A8X6TSQ5_NEPPI|nr:hypothetical protein NPIL_579701 [Nephila pilipes]